MRKIISVYGKYIVAAVLSVILITIITFVLISDLERKSFAAMIGTMGIIMTVPLTSAITSVMLCKKNKKDAVSI